MHEGRNFRQTTVTRNPTNVISAVWATYQSGIVSAEKNRANDQLSLIGKKIEGLNKRNIALLEFLPLNTQERFSLNKTTVIMKRFITEENAFKEFETDVATRSYSDPVGSPIPVAEQIEKFTKELDDHEVIRYAPEILKYLDDTEAAAQKSQDGKKYPLFIPSIPHQMGYEI